VPAYLAGRFELRDNGLYRKNPDNTATWLCAPFAIEAELRDGENRGWALLLSWRDREGKPHEEAFARSSFTDECADVRGRLADGGLSLNAAQHTRQALAEYLNVVSSPLLARSVPHNGWHMVNGRSVFVLPDTVYGDAGGKRVILQSGTRDSWIFGVSGTAAEWRDSIRRLACGNSRLIFSVSTAFAGSLLGIVNEDGGGIHVRGHSRTGKTALLRCAASVCSGTPDLGAAGFVRNWRATSSSLETIAYIHSDSFFAAGRNRSGGRERD
jgi:hypothetical protein